MGLREWWDETVVPRIIRFGCATEAIMELRREVVPLASGRVFELGCGGGLNQPMYDRSRVTSFAGLDPSPKLLEYACAEAEGLAASGTQAATTNWKADIRAGYGEAIPFPDASFDTVVCTYTLCSVNDQAGVLAELHRILKPGGTFLYLEHGRAPDANVAKWQRRIEPVWKRLFGNCHLTRPVSTAIAEAGFAVTPKGARYQEDAPRLAGWMEWGTAIKPV